ncbi:hypothetical protein ACHAXA_002500 [Cyclostephanos tholiformis]|uniref:RING-type domain-containing protein n=1 Tax=Cyclostephanos tholiformis TaxID=382380 RepID=A0ABD3SD67_9STRA
MSDNENSSGMDGASGQSQCDIDGVDSSERREGSVSNFDSTRTGGFDDNVDDESRGEEECVICFEKLSIQEWGRCTPCGHVFHKKCWWTWEDAHNKRVDEESRRRGQRTRSGDGCKCCLCNQVNKKFVDGDGHPAHNPTPYIAIDDPSDTGGNRFAHFFRNIGEEASGFINSLHNEFRDHFSNRNSGSLEQMGGAGPNRMTTSFVPPFFGSRTPSYGTDSSRTAPLFEAPFFRNPRSQQHTSFSNSNPFNLLRPGTRVVTQNLVQSPHLNCRGGTVLKYQPQSARYLVQLESDVSSFIAGSMAPVAIRPENLLQTAKIQIRGLRTEPTLNGKEATICSYSRVTNRYVVKVNHFLSTREISIQASNIRVPNGTLVRLEGLQQASQWNGKYGTVTNFVEDTNDSEGSGRYEVRLSRQYGVRVKIDNVRF